MCTGTTTTSSEEKSQPTQFKRSCLVEKKRLEMMKNPTIKITQVDEQILINKINKQNNAESSR
jgi:hypothetical protein